jgi:hypothetical protein
MELTQDQKDQQQQCQNKDCDCSTPTTQEDWARRMDHQGWMDYYDRPNKVHEDDPDYDRGYEAGYQNR